MNDISVSRQRPNFAAVPYGLVDDESISPQAKAVYMVLDRHADYENGSTFVGKGSVAKKCGFSKADSIDRYLKELREKGWVSWHRRWKRDTGKKDSRNRAINEYSTSPGDGFEPTTNLYVVHDRANVPPTAGEPVPPTAGEPVPPTAGEPVPPTAGTNENQVNENQVNENQVRANAPAAGTAKPLDQATAPSPKKSGTRTRYTYSDEFEEFWTSYPKAGRQSKRAAYIRWKDAIKEVDPTVIISGAQRYAADPNRSNSFTKHAQGWLNDGRWDDEPLPSRNPQEAQTKSDNSWEGWFGRDPNPKQDTQAIFGTDVIDHQEDHK